MFVVVVVAEIHTPSLCQEGLFGAALGLRKESKSATGGYGIVPGQKMFMEYLIYLSLPELESQGVCIDSSGLPHLPLST